MRSSRFSEKQIIAIFKEYETGIPTAEVWQHAVVGTAGREDDA